MNRDRSLVLFTVERPDALSVYDTDVVAFLGIDDDRWVLNEVLGEPKRANRFRKFLGVVAIQRKLDL